MMSNRFLLFPFYALFFFRLAYDLLKQPVVWGDFLFPLIWLLYFSLPDKIQFLKIKGVQDFLLLSGSGFCVYWLGKPFPLPEAGVGFLLLPVFFLSADLMRKISGKTLMISGGIVILLILTRLRSNDFQSSVLWLFVGGLEIWFCLLVLRVSEGLKFNQKDGPDDEEARKSESLQQALLESEKKYFHVFENLQDVYFEIMLDGEILEISPSVQHETGYAREALIHKSLFQFIDDEDLTCNFVLQLLSLNKVRLSRWPFRKANGEVIVFATNAVLIKDNQGKPIKIAGSMRSDQSEENREQPGNHLHPADGTLQYRQALEEFQQDKPFLKEVIDSFVGKLESELNQISNLIDQEKWDEVASSAHALKGGAANLIIESLAASAKNLELSAKSKNEKEIQPAYLALKESVKELQKWYLANRGLL